MSLCFLCSVASIPLDLILWLGATGGVLSSKDQGEYDNLDRSAKLLRSFIKMFRVIRILRLLRVKRVVLIIEFFFDFNLNIMTISKFIFALTMLAHLVACSFLVISSEDEGWIEQELLKGNIDQGRRYVASIYWTVTTMSTIGYGDVKALTMEKRIFSTVVQLVCAVAFMYSVSRMIHIIMLSTLSLLPSDWLSNCYFLFDWLQIDEPRKPSTY